MLGFSYEINAHFFGFAADSEARIAFRKSFFIELKSVRVGIL